MHVYCAYRVNLVSLLQVYGQVLYGVKLLLHLTCCSLWIVLFSLPRISDLRTVIENWTAVTSVKLILQVRLLKHVLAVYFMSQYIWFPPLKNNIKNIIRGALLYTKGKILSNGIQIVLFCFLTSRWFRMSCCCLQQMDYRLLF